MLKEKKRQLILLLIIFTFVVGFFHVLRITKNPHLQTYDQYYSLKLINDLKEKSSNQNYSKDFLFSPLDFIVSRTQNPVLYFRLLPFIIGLFNTSLIFILSKKLIGEKKLNFYLPLIIIVSPVFIFIHTTYNAIFLPLLFILLSAYLIVKDKYFLGMFFLLLSFLFNQKLFIIIILLLITFYEKFKSKSLLIPVIGIILITFIFTRVNVISISLGLTSLLQYFISDLGSNFGLGIFELIIGITGIVFSVNQKSKYLIYSNEICLIPLNIYQYPFLLSLV